MGDEGNGHKVKENGISGRKMCVGERVQHIVDSTIWKDRTNVRVETSFGFSCLRILYDGIL